jgi:hypothetical protein
LTHHAQEPSTPTARLAPTDRADAPPHGRPRTQHTLIPTSLNAFAAVAGRHIPRRQETHVPVRLCDFGEKMAMEPPFPWQRAQRRTRT